MRSRTAKLLSTLLLPVLLLAACGDDEDEPEATGGTDPTTTTTVDGDGSSTTAPPATEADVAVASTDLGDVLVDAEGFTLYAFIADTDGTPTCTGDCASAWPPATVDGDPTAGEGIADDVIATVEGDGGTQLTADGHPLYRFSGDAAAGEVNGQGVADMWYAVAPDGSLIDGPAEASTGGTDPDY
jgi:predicted lipoprotein with Yx(FWY)xxD motif